MCGAQSDYPFRRDQRRAGLDEATHGGRASAAGGLHLGDAERTAAEQRDQAREAGPGQAAGIGPALQPKATAPSQAGPVGPGPAPVDR